MKQIIHYKNGNVLSYTDFGDKNGFPILIQHGLIATITDYDLFEQLARLKTRLICIARPGYGESSPYEMKNIGGWGEVVAALVDELRLPQFDVLGMSSGAPYSYALGYSFPDKVRNLFIFSGIPALYDQRVVAQWPFEVKKDATIPEMEKLAQDLFFSNLSEADSKKPDIRDSMMNHGFGIAQDFRLRGRDWGFDLADLKAPVYMRHSKTDSAVPYATAVLTAGLLPNCTLQTIEDSPHFSGEALGEFIETMMAQHYQK